MFFHDFLQRNICFKNRYDWTNDEDFWNLVYSRLYIMYSCFNWALVFDYYTLNDKKSINKPIFEWQTSKSDWSNCKMFSRKLLKIRRTSSRMASHWNYDLYVFHCYNAHYHGQISIHKCWNWQHLLVWAIVHELHG